MKTSWEKTEGSRVAYVNLYPTSLVSGAHFGSGHTDNAGSASLDEFFAGKFHDIIRADFGQSILEEILANAHALIAPGRVTDNR